MLTGFFYHLRGSGLDVSLNEWLTLTEALDKGLCGGSFTRFYYLCRGILVKSEADFPAFNRAFLEYFEEIQKAGGQIPQELLDWLNNPAEQKNNYDADTARELLRKDLREIQRMFLERLQEQHEQHNGGSHWVGTGGMSPFGNAGNSPTGIRVGGQSRHRRAFEVAGEREFEDFRRDTVIGVRQFQTALRRLRQFSTRVDAPKEELDLDASIQATGEQAGRLKLVYGRPRRNTVKLLLLMDSGGSMDQHRRLCAALFQAVSDSSHFKDLKIYYFNNCIYSKLYTTPSCSYRANVDTEWVLRTLGEDYKVIVLGDAMMDPYELTGSSYYDYGNPDSVRGIDWLRRFRKKFEKMVWITPRPMRYPPGSYWRKSYDIISREFPMYTLTMTGLEAAFKRLMVSR